MTSRPASLVTIVRRALDSEASLPRGAAVILAVSGGPDSMALLDVAAGLAAKRDLRLFAHGVDHGLRREAAAELDLAEELAARRGVPFTRTRVDVARGGNLQARARAARWAALAAAARRCRATVLATAHHADDRAETFLLRLMRGAGLRGLTVLPARGRAPGARDIEVVRPLLRARREDILAHLARRRLAFADDPSNHDPRFLRARVRRDLLPLMQQLSPGIVGHLEALADEIAARVATPRHAERLDASAAPAWTDALPRRTQDALRAIARSGSTSARVWLPGGWVVGRDGRARPPAPNVLEETAHAAASAAASNEKMERVLPRSGRRA